MVARKTSPVPARIWKYGVPFGPVRANKRAVEEQFKLGRLFRNAVLEVSLKSRHDYREARSALVPEYAAAEQRFEKVKADRKAFRDMIKARNAGARKKLKLSDEDKRTRDELNEEYKTAKAAFDPLREFAKQSPELQARTAEINGELKAAIKRLRKEFGASHWGTRGRMEAAISQAMGEKHDPRFRSWDGSGSIAVQIQAPDRMFVNDLLGCKSRWARLKLTQVRRGKRRAVLWLRIGSDGRAPVWAKFPCVYHRPLPADAEIKSVWVQRGPVVGCHTRRWEVCFQIESKTFEPPARAPGPTLAVNIAWRKVGEAADDKTVLRVAYVVGTDGRHEQILLPPGVWFRLNRADRIRGHRDALFNSARDQLTKFLAPLRIATDDDAQWLVDDTQTLSQWRSPKRMVHLFQKWRRNRFEGDAKIFKTVEEWYKRDYHLHQYEDNERNDALGHRRHRYREIARALANRYSEIRIQAFDLRIPQRKGGVDDQWQPQRLQRTRASLHELRDAFKLACSNTGATFVTLPNIIETPKGPQGVKMTATCHGCGNICEWDRELELNHKCEHCGAEWDQDDNHCQNLLGDKVAIAAE